MKFTDTYTMLSCPVCTTDAGRFYDLSNCNIPGSYKLVHPMAALQKKFEADHSIE